ncbi:transglutaminase domain-containing protein [Mariniblastus sp.]|nr:transglutaminase domain-containing protein [Mariniblastus sp.]
MAFSSHSRVKTTATWPPVESLVLAILAGLVVLNLRWDMHKSALLIVAETVFYFSLPVVFMVWLQRRFGSDSKIFEQRRLVFGIQAGAVLFGLLPVLFQFLTRTFSYGDPFEVTALTMLMNATWYLAVFSRIQRFGRGAFVIGSCLVLFVCFMTQSAQVFVFAFLYLAISLWWLLGNYWERFESKTIDGESKSLPVRSLTVVVTFVLLVCVGSLALFLGPLRQAVGTTGFMPTSGGDSWYDAYARSGIGDGDMLTASENATSSGAVDSNQLIEDDRPSMYDIVSEKFDGPVKKKKRRNRSQALSAVAKEIDKVVLAEQAGRSFRTVREPVQKEEERKLQDRITKALFFVEGEVPARFGVDTFHHFDGWDWTKPDLGQYRLNDPEIRVEEKFGKPWFVLRTEKRDFLTASQAHRVKMMRLDTNSLPAPPFLKSWHIQQVDQLDLFKWNARGSLVMDGEFIPSHTVIDFVSEIPNHHILRDEVKLKPLKPAVSDWGVFSNWFAWGEDAKVVIPEYPVLETDLGSPYIQVAENATTIRLQEVLENATKNVSPGWAEVDSIVNYLRSNYELDSQRVAPSDAEDSVASFLDQAGGPSYLFATTATQLLRLAGYRTRLRSGFLVQRKDFDRVSRQSVVDSSNLHMWPEVCIDGKKWIPVEPTPGLPAPCNVQTFWQWTKVKLVGAINWTLGHPLFSSLTIGFVFCSFWFRKELVVTACWLVWRLVVMGPARLRLRFTRQLLDLRFWAAGLPRPAFVPINEWYTQVEPCAASEFIQCWHKANFSQDGWESRPGQTLNVCKQAVATLTCRRIRNFINQTTL